MIFLSPPFNLIYLSDGEEVLIYPERHETGEGDNPSGLFPGGRRVEVLRIWTSRSDLGRGVHYADVASRRLIAALPRVLDRAIADGKAVRIQASGTPPRTQYTITIVPA